MDAILTKEDIHKLNDARMMIFEVEMKLRSFLLDKEAQNQASRLFKARISMSNIANEYVLKGLK